VLTVYVSSALLKVVPGHGRPAGETKIGSMFHRSLVHSYNGYVFVYEAPPHPRLLTASYKHDAVQVKSDARNGAKSTDTLCNAAYWTPFAEQLAIPHLGWLHDEQHDSLQL
jgi:hypothetical protein